MGKVQGCPGVLICRIGVQRELFALLCLDGVEDVISMTVYQPALKGKDYTPWYCSPGALHL